MDNGMSSHWKHLADKMTYSLSAEQAELLKNGVVRRHRMRAHITKAVAVSTGAALAVLVALWGLGFQDNDAHTTIADANSPADSPVLRPESSSAELRDLMAHSKLDASDTSPLAVPLTAGTRFSAEEAQTTRTYHIAKGSVRFETQSGDTKKLLVRVGRLLIEDIGTVFTVEKHADGQARVAVSEGRVRVSWPDGHAELASGADGVFPWGEDSLFRQPDGVVADGDVKVGRPLVDWRVAAREGRNEDALAILEQNPSVVRNQVEDLLLAADVFRSTGHPELAVPCLKRIVRGFSMDARRAPAAFALGKVYLYSLNDPRQAAAAFAIAAQNRSPLAEEAKAREAEAWHLAHEPEKASLSAQQYLKSYPRGARADLVRAYCNDAK